MMFPRTRNKEIVPIEERQQVVNELFAKGGQLDTEYAEFYDYLGKLNLDKLSSNERRTLNWQWKNKSIPCELAADYLTSCEGATGDIIFYDEEDLVRRYNDPSLRKVKKPGKDKRRKDYIPSEDGEDEYEMRPRLNNIINAYELRREATDFDNDDYTDYELIETVSNKNGSLSYEMSTEATVMGLARTTEQLIDLFTEETERKVAAWVIKGKGKKYIYETLGITKRQLYTVFKHMKNRGIKEHLYN